MNKDINATLSALVPILNMNGEKVESIVAVHYWYKGTHPGDGKEREYMKEVAEITYENGYRKYADIGSDSNLTACYDVLAVIQQIKAQSTAIDRIERGVYEKHEPPKHRNDDRLIELIRNRQVSKTEARNSMGCSENWYDPVFAITEAFSNKEVEGMTDREIRLLIRLAEVMAEGLY